AACLLALAGVFEIGKAHLAHRRLGSGGQAYFSTFENLFGDSLGRAHGFLPSQVNSNSEYVSRIYSRSSNTAADFRLQMDFEEARADANLLFLRGVEARKKTLKVAQKKIRYGEDVQSDTSYDSDDSYR
ncbi:hypothetical protein, partial [Pseudomonas lundensis]|uniref:hypothetical protein n=1 Tax=Pseudomonas lundensis TaxID=86185 RepID=UPI001475966B